jgi:hypothetical protein
MSRLSHPNEGLDIFHHFPKFVRTTDPPVGGLSSRIQKNSPFVKFACYKLLRPFLPQFNILCQAKNEIKIVILAAHKNLYLARILSTSGRKTLRRRHFPNSTSIPSHITRPTTEMRKGDSNAPKKYLGGEVPPAKRLIGSGIP